MIHCNNYKCKFNDNEGQRCICKDTFYINRLCMTYKRGDGTRELMKQRNHHCKKVGGKYRSTNETVLR